MRTIRVPGELHLLPLIQHKHILELPPDILEHLLRLVRAPPFPSSRVTLAAPGHTSPHALCPESNPVEATAHVDYNTHDLAVVGALESLADSREHDVEPEGVDGGGSAFEAVGPFAAMLVLGVFPFGTHPALEEVVIGFES